MSTSAKTRVIVALAAALSLMAFAAAFALPEDAVGNETGSAAQALSFVVVVAVFVGVGVVIARRRPGNPVGWLLAVIGLLFGVVMASSTVSKWALETGAGPKAFGEWINVPANVWVFGLGLIGTQLPMRLPDGRLMSRRWRVFSRVCIGLMCVTFVGMAVQPGRVEGVAGTSNPIGSDALAPLASAMLLLILAFVGGIASLVLRYRRSPAHERAQLRWVAFGGLVFLAVYIVTLLLPEVFGWSDDSTAVDINTSFSQAAFAALPVAIGYAVLRNDLYDIDVVVNRTLVYGALTATLAAAYLGIVLLLQLALAPLTEQSDLAIAGSTLAVAALAGPARARIQALVDRRFYRRRYDAARTLESFGSRLRDEIELDSLSAELRTVVADTMQPAHVSLWLRKADA